MGVAKWGVTAQGLRKCRITNLTPTPRGKLRDEKLVYLLDQSCLVGAITQCAIDTEPTWAKAANAVQDNSVKSMPAAIATVANEPEGED